MVKKILSTIFSMELMGMGLLIFAFSMGFATFIEHKYSTLAARGLVYNAWWFELILLYAMVTLGYNIFRFKLFEPGRWGVLVFHLAFIFMIIGAGLTRYVGDEGTMSIRENSTSSTYITADYYFLLEATKDGDTHNIEKKSLVSVLKPKSIKARFNVGGAKVKVRSKGVFNPQQHGEILVVTVTVNGDSKDIPIVQGTGLEGPMQEKKVGGVNFKLGYARKQMQVPFKLLLNDFILETYPGSRNPSSYKSLVTLVDDEKGIEKPFEIKMNHVLDHRGYRFFQSSYDTDEKGTVLSVNKDKPGTTVSYFGYFLLFAGIVIALFDKKSRFRKYLNMVNKQTVVALLVFLFGFGSVFAQGNPLTNNVDFKKFGALWVQSGEGRIKPMHTFADEVMLKIHKSRTYNGYNGTRVVHGLFTNPTYWMRQEIIETIEHPALKRIGIEGDKAAFLDFFNKNNGQYLLKDDVRRVMAIPAAELSKPDRYLLSLDERVQICRMLLGGNLPLFFPQKNDLYQPWVSLADFSRALPSDSMQIYRGLMETDGKAFNKSVEAVSEFQNQYAKGAIPSKTRQHLEYWYMKIRVFERLAMVYGTGGLALLFFALMKIFSGFSIFSRLQSITRILLIAAFIMHTLGMVGRGIISNHVPLSNGYESVVFVAWSAILAGLLFSKRNPVIFSLGTILAAFAMLVSHMSFMNPQITNLVPVLKSYWLTIHVTMVTASYGFFGAAFIIGIFNMVVMAIAGKNKTGKANGLINDLYPVGQLAMEIGLYLITIGCFLGAIWANVSWGRYWSWDPKETWCLVSILVYAFVMHMHHIPGFGSKHYFSAASVIAFSTILMTYFGVNFFLGGMHAYAGDGSVQLSASWYIAVALIFGLIFVSGYRYNKR